MCSQVAVLLPLFIARACLYHRCLDIWQLHRCNDDCVKVQTHVLTSCMRAVRSLRMFCCLLVSDVASTFLKPSLSSANIFATLTS